MCIFADIIFRDLPRKQDDLKLADLYLVELSTTRLNSSIDKLLESKASLQGPSQLICVMCSEYCLHVLLHKVRNVALKISIPRHFKFFLVVHNERAKNGHFLSVFGGAQEQAWIYKIYISMFVLVLI